MEVKPFKTIDQQIEILKSRGLIIDDYEYAKSTLRDINYYRFSAYTLSLKNNDIFYDGTTFEDVMSIYHFDSEMRILITKLLEELEVSFKTHLAYYLSREYGPLGYLDKKIFKDEESYNKFVSDMEKDINDYGKNEIFIYHYQKEYSGQFPIWVLVECMTMSDSSKLFSYINLDDKRKMCKEYYHPINYKYIENWMKLFSTLRNRCAHRGRLYNRLFSSGIFLSHDDRRILNIKSQKEYKELITYLYVLKKLISNQSWECFENELEELIKKYPLVDLSKYGDISRIIKT